MYMVLQYVHDSSTVVHLYTQPDSDDITAASSSVRTVYVKTNFNLFIVCLQSLSRRVASVKIS